MRKVKKMVRSWESEPAGKAVELPEAGLRELAAMLEPG